MQTTNIAIGNGAQLEYLQDGTLIVRPNGSPPSPHWARSDIPPIGVAIDTTRYPNRMEGSESDVRPHLVMLQTLLQGVKLSQLRVTTRDRVDVVSESDLVTIHFSTENEILVMTQNDVVMSITIVGAARRVTFPYPYGCAVIGLRWKWGDWHRTDYRVEYKQIVTPPPPPLTQADIAIAIINGTSDDVLPKRDMSAIPEEVLCVGAECKLVTKEEALLVVANPAHQVRSITSVDSTNTVVFASVGDTIIEIAMEDGVVKTKEYIAVAKLKPTPLESLQAYIKDNQGHRVNVTLNDSEIRSKYATELDEQGYVLTDGGVMPYGEVPRRYRNIALMCRDYKTETIYVAPLKFGTFDVLDSNLLYLADAILGVDSDPDVLNNIIRSGGLYAECYRAASTLDVKVEERRYIPFIEYYKSLNVNAFRISTDYSAKLFRDMHGADLAAVNNLMLVTTKGVCPWVGTTHLNDERLMLSYLTNGGALLVGRYMALSKNDYREAIKAIKGEDYDVKAIDTIFGTVNGVYAPADDTPSIPE